MGVGVIGVEPVRPKYLTPLLAYIYTSKTPDQLEWAVKNGLLNPCVDATGHKTFCIDELDRFMQAGKKEKTK